MANSEVVISGITVRLYNPHLVKHLLRVLGAICPLLGCRLTLWLANRVLRMFLWGYGGDRWYQCREYREEEIW